jgi:hypothetical protein
MNPTVSEKITVSAVGQFDHPHRRIQGGEEKVLGEDLRPGQLVEQGRFARIRIADQSDHRMRRLLTLDPVQITGPLDLVEFLFQAGDLLLQDPTVRLDLGFPRAADKTQAATLAFEVCPTADQAAALIVQMGEIDLQPPFPRLRPVGENFQNQPGAVDDFDIPLLFKIALLDRREIRVHIGKIDALGL